ncbi:MAG: carbohydrate ABC transporter permease [Microlunatus sp.]|nr:carbohydrate ABC transporter permease [Microlunatus sp.]
MGGTAPRRGWQTAIKIVIGVLIVLWSLVPICWALVVAFSRAADIRRDPVSPVPLSVTLDNFHRLLAPSSQYSGGFYAALASSLIQASGTTLLTLLIALPAAYAFARLRFRGARVLLVVITVTLAIPVYLVLIPLFQLATATGQINTQQGVILVLTSATLPLSIWILRSHISTLPADLEAAAQVDGAGTATILTKIVGPLVAPGLVAAAVVTFITAWSAFLIPLVYANSPATQPLTVLIPSFASKFSSDYGLQAATGLIAVIPPVLLVIFLQRHLLAGLLRGASR